MMDYQKIPSEMRTYIQWVVWKYEQKDGSKKPTKVPYSPIGHFPASVTNPQAWGTFEQAVSAASKADPKYDGIGFVLTDNDPYAFIDLDDTKGDMAALEYQLAIDKEFDSYAERSPSGKGLHIIVKGKIPCGKRNSHIEIYSSERYMTMTGNVYRDVPIADYHLSLNNLWKVLGGKEASASYLVEQTEAKETDEAILQKATKAANGEKFKALYKGRWEELFPSQSEADFSLISMIAFYTQNRSQIRRLFLASALGVRSKALREDYFNNIVNKCFEQALPPVDITGLLKNVADKLGYTDQAVTTLSFQKISDDEWLNAKLTPEIIVDNYLYADVGLLIAPGGVGKTSLVLFEAISIVLSLGLYGRGVRRPGKVVIVTAEDSRELMVARLHRIAISMKLTPEMIKKVKEDIRIEYVGSGNFRLCQIVDNVVCISDNVASLAKSLRPLNPTLLIFDPAVSFGVGESRVNDAEQGLIVAARYLRDALGCGVRFIHHSGKQNARDQAIDQYAGRGGSAMADGARMVSVLRKLEPKDWFKVTGENLEKGAEGLLLALPKGSYSPSQPHIYIERKGYQFRYVDNVVEDIGLQHDAADEEVLKLIRSVESSGKTLTKGLIEKADALKNFTRIDIRSSLKRLENEGAIKYVSVKGVGRGKYVRTIDSLELPEC